MKESRSTINITLINQSMMNMANSVEVKWGWTTKSLTNRATTTAGRILLTKVSPAVSETLMEVQIQIQSNKSIQVPVKSEASISWIQRNQTKRW